MHQNIFAGSRALRRVLANAQHTALAERAESGLAASAFVDKSKVALFRASGLFV